MRVNFLAHSVFGFNDSALIAGQICGDFVRGRDLSRFPERLERGIRLHRYLDRFTDTHPALTEARHQITIVPLRFSGIVVDVMFDHYLALHWDMLYENSLDSHAHAVSSALREYEHYFPDSLKRFMVILERERILQGNVQLRGIEITLSRIAGRSDKYSDLFLNIAELETLREHLLEPFNVFFPDLQLAAQRQLSQPEKSRHEQ